MKDLFMKMKTAFLFSFMIVGISMNISMNASTAKLQYQIEIEGCNKSLEKGGMSDYQKEKIHRRMKAITTPEFIEKNEYEERMEQLNSLIVMYSGENHSCLKQFLFEDCRIAVQLKSQLKLERDKAAIKHKELCKAATTTPAYKACFGY